MVPVEFFTQFAQVCADRPFLLLPKDQQIAYLAEAKKIVEKLRTHLENNKLQQTHAYKIVQVMDQAIQTDTLDEARFAEALAQLDTLYGQSTKPDFLKKVRTMDSFAEHFKKRAHEFAILEHRIAEAVKTLSPQQIAEHDFHFMKDIGLFYVLEYTLILEQEMLKVKPAQQTEILDRGIQVTAGNLPGLRPLMKSMRQEFAFQIYHAEQRWRILRIFYDFETILDTNDTSQIMTGFRTFNIDLLKILITEGIQSFTGIVYKPYPDNTLLQDIINDLSK